MTYRYMPRGWQRILQWATLLATVLTGYAIMLLPEDDARRSQMETLAFRGDIFAWTLILAAGVGLVCELWMARRWRPHEDESLIGIVAWCHIICAGAMAGFGLAALAGVIIEHSTNFGGPVLAALLALYHAGYVRRRPRPYPVGKESEQVKTIAAELDRLEHLRDA